MDIKLESTYYNCSFSLESVTEIADGSLESILNFNAGWLSCRRPFIFTKKNVQKFTRQVKELNAANSEIATLENTARNMMIQLEYATPEAFMFSAKGFEDSEFEQSARLGFNINAAQLNEVFAQMNALVEKSS